jgi:hypothetical protein
MSGPRDVNDSNKISDHHKAEPAAKTRDQFTTEPRSFRQAGPPARSLHGTNPVSSPAQHSIDPENSRAINNGQSSQAARDGRVPQSSHGPFVGGGGERLKDGSGSWGGKGTQPRGRRKESDSWK